MAPAESPLDLWLNGSYADVFAGDARPLLGDLQAHRVPDRWIPRLEQGARWPGLEQRAFWCGVIAAFSWFPVLVVSRWIEGIQPAEDAPVGALARWYGYALLAASAVAAARIGGGWLLRRIAVARDLRERRLVVEEGEVTRKWTESRTMECLFARIGRRTVELEDPQLFRRLGSGLRYRMHLTAHARLLVAIESIEEPERPGGYRDAPVKAR